MTQTWRLLTIAYLLEHRKLPPEPAKEK